MVGLSCWLWNRRGVGNEIIVPIVVESWFGGLVGDGGFELLALESKRRWQ